MIKHVGRHGEKKVTVLFRTVPNETSMCLVLYSDLLPRTYHDPIMKILESEPGQQANEFADALFRNLLPDGRNILETLHREGLIRKVPTSQIIIMPDNKNSCRLDELNTHIKQLDSKKSDDASRTTSGSVTGEVYEQAVPTAPKKTKVEKPVQQADLTVETMAAMAKPELSRSEIMKELKESMSNVKRLQKMLMRNQLTRKPAVSKK